MSTTTKQFKERIKKTHRTMNGVIKLLVTKYQSDYITAYKVAYIIVQSNEFNENNILNLIRMFS